MASRKLFAECFSCQGARCTQLSERLIVLHSWPCRTHHLVRPQPKDGAHPRFRGNGGRGYLTNLKMHPPTTLRKAYTEGSRGSLGGWTFSHGRGTTVHYISERLGSRLRLHHLRRAISGAVALVDRVSVYASPPTGVPCLTLQEYLTYKKTNPIGPFSRTMPRVIGGS